MVVTLQSIHVRDFTTLACIIREDSAFSINIDKQVFIIVRVAWPAWKSH